MSDALRQAISTHPRLSDREREDLVNETDILEAEARHFRESRAQANRAEDEGEEAVRCAFCGKFQDQVRKMIAGPDVFICNVCTSLAVEILEEELGEAWADEQGPPDPGGASG